MSEVEEFEVVQRYLGIHPYLLIEANDPDDGENLHLSMGGGVDTEDLAGVAALLRQVADSLEEVADNA